MRVRASAGRDLIKKLLVQDRTKRLGNMKVIVNVSLPSCVLYVLHVLHTVHLCFCCAFCTAFLGARRHGQGGHLPLEML